MQATYGRYFQLMRITQSFASAITTPRPRPPWNPLRSTQPKSTKDLLKQIASVWQPEIGL